jgi:hypothetical protein
MVTPYKTLDCNGFTNDHAEAAVVKVSVILVAVLVQLPLELTA